MSWNAKRGFLSTGKPASPLGKPLPYQIKYVGLCLLLRVVSIRRATDGRRTSRQHDWLSAVSTQAGGTRFDSRHDHAYSRKEEPTYTERIYQTAI
ncbi:hypothetical protein [Prevotella denticola]|uniref:hypothetical protein n=1 Tax=Prevotella denticola TaxID=28129 RepID=UPI002151D9CD|nr:hypothetical protein [Prevotella denticola]